MGCHLKQHQRKGEAAWICSANQHVASQLAIWIGEAVCCKAAAQSWWPLKEALISKCFENSSHTIFLHLKHTYILEDSIFFQIVLFVCFFTLNKMITLTEGNFGISVNFEWTKKLLTPLNHSDFQKLKCFLK